MKEIQKNQGNDVKNVKQDFESYKRPAVTVDVIIFTVKNNTLNVLLIKREEEPFKGFWAIPGRFVQIHESIEDAAILGLEEKTGMRNVYLEQLYSFGEPRRDPRGRVITITYFALVDYTKISLKSRDEVNIKFHAVHTLPKQLAFDHRQIIEYAVKRLQWKIEYTTVAFSLLSEKFTLTDMQNVYETILNKSLDKRNFRKKILSLGIVKPTKDKTMNVSHRPAQLYEFKGKLGEIIDLF